MTPTDDQIHIACAIYTALSCGPVTIHKPCTAHPPVLRRRMAKRLSLNGGDAHKAAIREFGYSLQRAIAHPWTKRMMPDFVLGA